MTQADGEALDTLCLSGGYEDDSLMTPAPETLTNVPEESAKSNGRGNQSQTSCQQHQSSECVHVDVDSDQQVPPPVLCCDVQFTSDTDYHAVFEESLQRLHNINEGIERLRQMNPNQSSLKLLALRRASAGLALGANASSTLKDRVHRRMSTSVLLGVLGKTEDKDGETTAPTVELSTLPNKEICTCVTTLIKHVTDMARLSMDMESEYISLKGQLSVAHSQKEQMKVELERLSTDKRHGYHHSKQLEELRNLQECISHKRQMWERERVLQKQKLESQYTEVEQQRKELKAEKEDIMFQKEEIQRQREALQKQIDFYSLQQFNMKESPGSWNEPMLRQKHNPLLGIVTSEQAGHERIAAVQTDDLTQDECADETLHPSFISTTQSGDVPINLFSTTNELKISHPTPCKDRPRPGTKQQSATLLSTSSKSSVHQVIPFKLSSSVQDDKQTAKLAGLGITRTQSVNIRINCPPSQPMRMSKSHPHLPAPNTHKVVSVLPMKITESRAKSASPVVSRSSPVVSRSSPVVSRTSPVVSRTSPVVSMSSPVVSRTSPVVSRSSPVVSTSSPLVSRSSSVESRSSPVVSRSSPGHLDSTDGSAQGHNQIPNKIKEHKVIYF